MNTVTQMKRTTAQQPKSTERIYSYTRVKMSTGHVNHYSLVAVNGEFEVRTPGQTHLYQKFIAAANHYILEVEECRGYAAFFKGKPAPNNTAQLTGWLEAQAHADNMIREDREQRYDGETAWRV